MTGIYLIKNKITNECYIGQSKNIQQRFNNHINSMKNKKYSLYSDMRHYGVKSFDFSIIEECSISQLDKREMFWIHQYLEEGFSLYNIIGVPQKEKLYGKRYKKITKKY